MSVEQKVIQPGKIVREPLLHFFMLGALLFVLFAWKNDDALRGPDEIVVDAQQVDALSSQFQRAWQRAPTPEEMSALIDNWVREEVLYREGLALGLDRGDPVMRRRVAQKMEFISEDLVDAGPVGDELQEWFDANAEDYRLDPRFTFQQVYFDPSTRSGSLEATIESALRSAQQGQVPNGDATLLPAALDDASLAEVRRTFGDRCADSLAETPVGDWTGPLVSGYGLHLVVVREKQESRIPAFDEVRAAVERDFRADRTREFKDVIYEKLRERYTVTYEDGLELADGRDDSGNVR